MTTKLKDDVGPEDFGICAQNAEKARHYADFMVAKERERCAAVEAALKADACIEALRAIVEQQRSMGFDGSPSDELMDEALRALAAVGAA